MVCQRCRLQRVEPEALSPVKSRKLGALKRKSNRNSGPALWARSGGPKRRHTEHHDPDTPGPAANGVDLDRIASGRSGGFVGFGPHASRLAFHPFDSLRSPVRWTAADELTPSPTRSQGQFGQQSNRIVPKRTQKRASVSAPETSGWRRSHTRPLPMRARARWRLVGTPRALHWQRGLISAARQEADFPCR